MTLNKYYIKNKRKEKTGKYIKKQVKQKTITPWPLDATILLILNPYY